MYEYDPFDFDRQANVLARNRHPKRIYWYSFIHCEVICQYYIYLNKGEDILDDVAIIIYRTIVSERKSKYLSTRYDWGKMNNFNHKTPKLEYD